jgi:membrane-bound lytic murein transglycosylase A
MAVLSLNDPAAAQDIPSPPGAALERVLLSDLPGWRADDHRAAFETFLNTCQPTPALREAVPALASLREICAEALKLAARPVDAEAARTFFEQRFEAYRIRPTSGAGFLTGYFEPEFEGSLSRAAEFPTPLYGRPPDLVTRGVAGEPGDDWSNIDPELASARRTPQGLAPHFDRGAIDDGGLAGQNLEIAWLRDPVDRFVMQVQGSARLRLRLPDGRTLRLAYAGRNGYPYTSLGRTLSEEEGIPPAQMTMDRLVARLKGDLVAGQALIRRNRSFVFFRIASELPADQGPIGGAGVPLTAHRSIAADRTIWPYGLPVWLSGRIPATPFSGNTGNVPELAPLDRLTVIQDTGSAIVGPSRFDLYFGSGAAAGDLAGRVRHEITATVLWPRRRS